LYAASIFQVLQQLPTAVAACQHNLLHQALRRCFATTSQAAQQAQAETLQQQQQQQHQQPSSSAPSTVAPALLAFDEVYVSCSNLRAGAPPSAGAMQARHPITAVFLHGLLGSSRNWRSFSRKLAVEAAAKANRDVRVLLLDLRCHGDSAARFGFHPPHDMAAAASDVTAIIQHELQGQAPHLLVGLSLGGKIALQTLKQMVEAQEADQHQQQHLYERTPRIMPPADVVDPSCKGASSSEPGLRGLPQQVHTSFVVVLCCVQAVSTCLDMLSPHS
jgi:predicted alpha/beta-fold hydrolase